MPHREKVIFICWILFAEKKDATSSRPEESQRESRDRGRHLQASPAAYIHKLVRLRMNLSPFLLTNFRPHEHEDRLDYDDDSRGGESF